MIRREYELNAPVTREFVPGGIATVEDTGGDTLRIIIERCNSLNSWSTVVDEVFPRVTVESMVAEKKLVHTSVLK